MNNYKLISGVCTFAGRRKFFINRAALIIFTAQLFGIPVHSQTISLTGTVADSYGIPVRGAIVKLLSANLADTTDSAGSYEITMEISRMGPESIGTATRLHGHRLHISLEQKERVRVRIHDLDGRLLHVPVDRIMEKGEHTLTITEILGSSRMRILKVISGNQVTIYTYMPVWSGNEGAALVMAKKTAVTAVDSLSAKAGGFETAVKAVEAITGTVDFVLTSRPAPSARLLKEIDLTPYGSDKGFYVSVGDLDNDGKVDYLLHRVGKKTTAGYVLALDHDGNKLWDLGNVDLEQHEWWDDEPPNRAICSVFDVDQDGRSEVVIETALDGKYQFMFLDGKTGSVKKVTDSPFTDSRFRNANSSRPHPLVLFAYMDGKDQLPTIVFKYGASNKSETMAVGYDKDLNQKWIYGEDEGSSKFSMGHVADVADIDNDGREELLMGYVVLDDDGTKMWEPEEDALLKDHADMVTAADILPGEPGMEVLIARCHTDGKLHTYSSSGTHLWTHSEHADHTEMVLAGNFIEDRSGSEVMFQIGHEPNYVTVDHTDGSTIKKFDLNYGNGYPDWPAMVTWKNANSQSLWMPIVRKLVDGNGNVVTDLGDNDDRVVEVLNPGDEKRHTATEAFAVDVYGDNREEVLLYCREGGSNGIFIFTQSDNEGGAKPYVHQRNVYNIRTPN